MAHQNPQVKFEKERNSRGLNEISVEGRHISIKDLKRELPKADKRQKLSAESMIKYLEKEIPKYPNPVTFEVANVSHVTNNRGLEGILKSEMIRPPKSEMFMGSNCVFSWWNLSISEDEKKSAETRYLNEKAPDMSQNPPRGGHRLLEKFTTSPLFQPESRYGNYRFVFPLPELMQLYRDQVCEGSEPVLRVFKTLIYNQEIVYAVLVHSPEKNDIFTSKYPLLEESDWVQYCNGRIVWKAQAICETHKYELIEPEMKARSLGKRKQFYVWDQVSLAFHLPNDSQALKIPRKRLIEALEACKKGEIDISGEHPKTAKVDKEKEYEIAKEKVQKLKTESEKVKTENEEGKPGYKRSGTSQGPSPKKIKKEK